VKITRVEAIPLRLPELDATVADGIQDDVLVRVHTDEGITGIGEADSSPSVVKALVDAPESWWRSRGLAGMLVGEDPLHTERLWDIKGKALGLPVHALLGGARRETLPVYASTLFDADRARMRERAQRYVSDGYRAVKFGWGPMGPDFATDVALVREARAAIGDAALLVDAGAAWTFREAVLRLDAFREYAPFWLEEALASDDLEGWARLAAAAGDIRLATGEQESLASAFRDLLDVGHLDVVQPDLARAGGFTQCRRIAELAADRRALLVPHAWKSEILVAATVHFAATLPAVPFVEYSMAESPLRRELARSGLVASNGAVKVSQRPGLGVELDEDIVTRYRTDR